MASMILTQCSTCDARIRAPKELLGKTRKCPSCKRPFEVRLPLPTDELPRIVVDMSTFDVDLDLLLQPEAV